MPTIVVEVMPKAELLDPQGKAVAGALARLGNSQITGVRVGKRFELTIDGAVDDSTFATVRALADAVLSNSVIEDVVGIYLEDDANDQPDVAAPAATKTRCDRQVGLAGLEGRAGNDAAISETVL